MIETYDPDKQAVVTVGFATGNPVTVKMKLAPSLKADEPTKPTADYFAQEKAFREAHQTCVPDRLEYTVWLPRGVDQAYPPGGLVGNPEN
jgi:hypothetical protein